MLGALEPPGAEWSAVGVLAGQAGLNVFYTPRPGQSRPESADMFCGPFSPENFFILQPAPWLCAFGGMGVLKDPGKQPWMGEWAVALCWICCVTLDKWCTSGSFSLM